MNNTAEIFLNKYREFENNIRDKYHLNPQDKDSPIYILKQQREFKPFLNQIDVCKDIRNMLSHRPKIGGDYPIIPSEKLINILDELNERIKNPPKISSIMIRAQDIFYAKPTDPVRPIIKIMRANTYTHIPILVDGKVKGVFSEDTLLSLLSDEEIIAIDDNTKLNDINISKYLSLNSHKTESFRFVAKNTTIFETKELFRNALSHRDRIGLVFITQNGSQNERVLGILTSWDLPREE